MKSALWRSIKQARPLLSDHQIDSLMAESAQQEQSLVQQGVPLDSARELARETLFPPDLDPWAGDEKYGPMR